MLTSFRNRVIQLPVGGIILWLAFMLALALLGSALLDPDSAIVATVIVTFLLLLDLHRIQWFEVKHEALCLHTLFQTDVLPLATLEFRFQKTLWSRLVVAWSYVAKHVTTHDFRTVQVRVSGDTWRSLAIVSERAGDGLILWKGNFFQLLGLPAESPYTEVAQRFQRAERMRLHVQYRLLSVTLALAFCGLGLTYYFPEQVLGSIQKILNALPIPVRQSPVDL